MIKQLGILLLVLFFVIAQTSIVPIFFPLPSGINVLIIAILYFLITLKTRNYFIWTAILGLLADIFSSLPVGVITISLLGTALVAYLLYLNYFSHRTGLTLILLVVLMCAVYALLLYGISQAWIFIASNPTHLVFNPLAILSQTFATTVTCVLCYLVFNQAVKRFRDRFLIQKS
ncbi:MAG: hypothetical protein WC497_03610 [Patescibacteria group bacterium]